MLELIGAMILYARIRSENNQKFMRILEDAHKFLTEKLNLGNMYDKTR